MKRSIFGFNPLALLAGILVGASLAFPWWSLEVQWMPRTTYVFPHLIDGPLSEFVGYKRSAIMTVLAVLLIVCAVIFLIGSFFKGNVIVIMLATTSVLVGVAIYRFLVRVEGVAAMYNIPIQGHGVGDYGGFASTMVYAEIEPGLYLAGFAVILGLISSLFHNKITRIGHVKKLSYNDEEFIDLSEQHSTGGRKNES